MTRSTLSPLALGLTAATALAVLSLPLAASAQYLSSDESRQSGYFSPSDQRAHQAQAGKPGMYGPTSAPAIARFGIAMDLGAAFLQADSVDTELYEPNGAAPLSTFPAAHVDFAGFIQLGGVARVGFGFGVASGGRREAVGTMVRAGAIAELGFSSPTGLGLYGGAGIGYGSFQAESEDAYYGLYDYDATGLWLRGVLRIEQALTPNVMLRFSGTYDNIFVRDDTVTIDILSGPEPYLGEPDGNVNGFGFQVGVGYIF